MELLPGLPRRATCPTSGTCWTARSTLRRAVFSGETPAQPGVVRHWEEIFYPVRGASGAIEGMGVVAVEVTEQRRAQAALRAERGDVAADPRLRTERAAARRRRRLHPGREHRVRPAVRLRASTSSSVSRRGAAAARAARGPRRAAPGRTPRTPTTRLMGHGRDLRGRRKDGTEFPVEVGLAVAAGVPGLVTCVVTDISERKRVEAEKAAAARRRARRERPARPAAAGHGGRAGAAAAAASSCPSCSAGSLDAVAADAAAILLVDDEGRSLRIAAQVGLDERLAAQVRVPLGEGVVGAVARDARPAIIHDIADSPPRGAPVRRWAAQHAVRAPGGRGTSSSGRSRSAPRPSAASRRRTSSSCSRWATASPSPSTAPGPSTGRTRSPRRCSAACCPSSCRRWTVRPWRCATCPGPRAPTSEATGTTCCTRARPGDAGRARRGRGRAGHRRRHGTRRPRGLGDGSAQGSAADLPGHGPAAAGGGAAAQRHGARHG